MIAYIRRWHRYWLRMSVAGIVAGMGGLATAASHQPGHSDATAAVVAARPPRTFTYGDGAKTAIRAVTPKRFKGKEAL